MQTRPLLWTPMSDSRALRNLGRLQACAGASPGARCWLCQMRAAHPQSPRPEPGWQGLAEHRSTHPAPRRGLPRERVAERVTALPGAPQSCPSLTTRCQQP